MAADRLGALEARARQVAAFARTPLLPRELCLRARRVRRAPTDVYRPHDVADDPEQWRVALTGLQLREQLARARCDAVGLGHDDDRQTRAAVFPHDAFERRET